MDKTPRTITFRLPDWLDDIPTSGARWPDVDQRMSFVLDLARRHVAEQTGGPFVAAIFDRAGGLVSIGVNLVVPSSAAIAHAEIMAIALAGQRHGHFDLGALDAELVTSTEPCAMCLGAVSWSGVRRLICGARDEDARAVGFDEGLKPEGWVDHLRDRGIAVERDVQRAEAAAVMRDYASGGGAIYNAGVEAARDRSGDA